MAAFCEELLSENDFETVFATSVLMTNMVPLLRQFKRSLYTDQKDEWMSWMLIVCCWIAKIYQSITVDYVLTRTLPA